LRVNRDHRGQRIECAQIERINLHTQTRGGARYPSRRSPLRRTRRRRHMRLIRPCPPESTPTVPTSRIVTLQLKFYCSRMFHLAQLRTTRRDNRPSTVIHLASMLTPDARQAVRSQKIPALIPRLASRTGASVHWRCTAVCTYVVYIRNECQCDRIAAKPPCFPEARSQRRAHSSDGSRRSDRGACPAHGDG
jgi:hypothetical protein